MAGSSRWMDFDEGYEAGREMAQTTRAETLPRYAELLAYAAATCEERCEERGVFADRVVPLACAFADVVEGSS